MKRNLLMLAMILLSSFVYAQKKPKDTAKVVLPTKDGLVFFEKVVDSLNDQRKEELFNKSLKWMADSFVDSKEVIQIKDKEAGSIVGTGIFDYITPGLFGGQQRMSFMVEITVKDNKSRIRLYQFKYKTLGSTGYGLTSPSSDSDYNSIDNLYQLYLQERRFPKANRGYYQVIKDRIEGIIQSYKTFLSVNSKKDDF